MRLSFHPKKISDSYGTWCHLFDHISEVFDERLLFLQTRAILAFCLQTGLKIDLALVVPVENDSVSKIIKLIFKCDEHVPWAFQKYGLRHEGDSYLYFEFSDIRFICNPASEEPGARRYSPPQIRREIGLSWCNIVELDQAGRLVRPMPGSLAAML